jgi:hypothetical protein
MRPTDRGDAPTDSHRRALGIAEVLLALVLALAPWVWRVLAHDDLPAGDAWAYERIARTLHDTGHLRMVGWNDINLVGMLWVTAGWTAITGFNSTALHLLGSLMAFVGLLGATMLLRDTGVQRRLIALVLIGAGWGLPGVSGTYLSDAFAFAGAIWAVALAVRVVVRPPRSLAARCGLVSLAALAGAYGVSVRQQAAAGIAAALVVLWFDRTDDRWSGRRLIPMFLGVVVLVAVPVLWWRSTFELSGGVMVVFLPRSTVAGMMHFLLGMGLVASAASLARSGAAAPIDRRRALTAAVGGIVITVLTVAAGSTEHDLLDLPGVLWDHVGTLWFIVIVLPLAIVATDGLTRLWNERPARPSGFFIATMVAVLAEAASVVITGNYFSRYSLLSVAMVATSVSAQQRPAVVPVNTAAGPSTRMRLAMASGLTCILILGAYYFLDNSLMQRGGLRDAAAVASCLGVEPQFIDGGFDWNGKYYQGIANPDMPPTIPDGLPENGQRRPFVELHRRAGVVGARPAESASLVVIGPFDSSALLPGNHQRSWLVLRASEVQPVDVARCHPSAQ